jgi:NAD(P)-dependent dehydrogenase (short-subunit alcohol dehydrogenase family)
LNLEKRNLLTGPHVGFSGQEHSMSEAKAKKTTLPPQAQARQPGREEKMHPKPESEARRYKAAGKLEGKWRGSAAAIAASENRSRFISRKKARTSRFCISKKTEDADRTRTLVEREGRRCPLLRADVGERQACEGAIRRTLDALGKLDILVDIAAEQHVAKSFGDIPPEQLEQDLPDQSVRNVFIDRRLHAIAIDAARRKRNPRQRGRAGSDLDAADPRDPFLASDDASYISGQVLQPSGGQIVA